MASIADILIAKGNAQANARSQRGNIYADLIRNLSSVPGQIVQGQRQQQQFDIQQQRLGLETQRAKTEETLAQQQGELNQQRLNDARQQTEGAQELARSISAHTSTDPETGHVTIDHDAVYNEVAGKYPKVATGFIDDWEKYSNHVADTQETMLKATRSKLAILGSLAGSVVEAPESERAMRYASMMGQAQSIFKSVPEISGELSKLPPVYTPESDARLKQIFEQSRSQADRVEEALKRSTTSKNVSEADKAAADAEKLRAEVAGTMPQKPVNPPTAGTFEDYVTKTYGANPTPAQILEGRKVYNQSDDRPRVSVNLPDSAMNDVKETIKGMKDGTLPPIMPGRASKEYTALTAEAHRQGYDLATSAADWQATQKHFATLNGAQQTRLRQAISTASDSLGVIEDLAKKWDGGKYPVLNRANLKGAVNGVLGPEAQKIATNLQAQITDVQSELGNVYMGGNSPTDYALQLAEKNLSADWTKAQLLSAIDLARTNLKIRQNAIKNTEAITTTSQKTAPVADEKDPLGLFK